jgi:hypothetical protein
VVEGPARRDWRSCKGHCQYNLSLGERLARFFGVPIKVFFPKQNPHHERMRF